MEIALPGTARLPPPAFSSSLPAIFFFSNSNYIELSNRFLATCHLSHRQSHGHETTSAPASTASTTTPGPITAASSRRRSLGEESATRALFAWPNNGESRLAREHCNQQIGCGSPVRCRLLLYVLLHCCNAVLGRFVGAWWVVGGWWTAARPLPEMAEYRQKMTPPPVCFLFIQGPQEPTN